MLYDAAHCCWAHLSSRDLFLKERRGTGSGMMVGRVYVEPLAIIIGRQGDEKEKEKTELIKEEALMKHSTRHRSIAKTLLFIFLLYLLPCEKINLRSQGSCTHNWWCPVMLR